MIVVRVTSLYSSADCRITNLVRSDDPVLRSDCSAALFLWSISPDGRSVPKFRPTSPKAMNATPIIKRRACVACTAAKAKCTPQDTDLCQRCARLGKSCTYLDLPQTKRKHKVAPRYYTPTHSDTCCADTCEAV